MERDRKGEERMTDWDINSREREGEMRWEMEAERQGVGRERRSGTGVRRKEIRDGRWERGRK